MRKDSVIVLMSTYNGENYLIDQIESILHQEGVEVDLYVRDDGSTDSTKDILKKYEKLPNCHIDYSSNVGAKESFLLLIDSAPEADFYSFSDQDDVWEKDKLKVAIQSLKSNDAILYHGLAGRVNKELSPLKNKDYVPVDSFGASLLASATGCTMVFKNELMIHLRKYHPFLASMHDAWVYRVCYAIGLKVIYDKQSHMKYRQHENNVSGGEMGLKKKLSVILKNKNLKLNLAKDIYYGHYENMSETNKKILMQFIKYNASFINRIRIACSNKYQQHSPKTSLQNRLLFILGLV